MRSDQRQLDRRWSESWPTPAFLFDGSPVRAHPDFLKYVVFIGLEDRGEFHPLGTGFLVCLRKDGFMCSFVVTAAHVLDGANNFSVRLNLKAGGSDTLLTSTANLLLHDNPDNDIAVFPLKVDPTVFDVLAPAFTREDLDRIDAEKFDIGYGDIVHAIGLYTSHHGFIKNIPVVRSGSVAALLEEPVLGPNDRYIEAYLIDLRTIAGLSGSPVFLMPPEIAVGENGLLSKRRTPPTIPLGVLLAYHLVAHANDQIIVPRHPSKSAGAEDADGFTADERNTGFGVVVPFDRVAEILKSDRVWDFMALGVEARNRERGKAKPA